MKRESVYITGKLAFAYLNTADTKWGEPRWKVRVYPNEASMPLVHKMVEEGIKNQLKKDDDGYFITFSRPTSIKTKDGKTIGLLPPVVLQADGKTPLPTSQLIGNGSDGVVKIDYRTWEFAGRPGKSARLEGVRVDNLVPFEMKRDWEEPQLRMASGLPEQPAETW